jgi:microcystin degradation protein MlrC
MAATGSRAAELLDRLIREKRPLYKAFRQVDFLIPLVWQCTLAEPTKGVFDLMDEIERGSASHNQGIVSITHTPGFPPADIKECGPALVVYGRDQETADAAADRILAAIKRQGTGVRRPALHRRRGGAGGDPPRARARQSRSSSPTSRTTPAPAGRRTRSGSCAR